MEKLSKLYSIAKKFVKEYENNIKEIEVIDPQQISLLGQIDETNVSYLNKIDLITEQEFSEDVFNCYFSCLNYFPIHLRPNKSKSWLQVIEKLNRIDKIPFEEIVRITKLAREDAFWSKNFLSLTKLRMKDKQKVAYIVVFSEKFKAKEKTINRQTADTIKSNSENW